MAREAIGEFALTGRAKAVPEARPTFDARSLNGGAKHVPELRLIRVLVAGQHSRAGLALVEPSFEQRRQFSEDWHPTLGVALVLLRLEAMDQDLALRPVNVRGQPFVRTPLPS